MPDHTAVDADICPFCDGAGEVDSIVALTSESGMEMVLCSRCGGTGRDHTAVDEAWADDLDTCVRLVWEACAVDTRTVTAFRTMDAELTRLRAENAELHPTGWITTDSKTSPLIKQLTVALDKLGDRYRNSDIIRLGWESARELERRFAEQEAENAALRARMDGDRLTAIADREAEWMSAARAHAAAWTAMEEAVEDRREALYEADHGQLISDQYRDELNAAIREANEAEHRTADALRAALAALDTESEVGK